MSIDDGSVFDAADFRILGIDNPSKLPVGLCPD